jgi:hypothetical protein
MHLQYFSLPAMDYAAEDLRIRPLVRLGGGVEVFRGLSEAKLATRAWMSRQGSSVALLIVW